MSKILLSIKPEYVKKILSGEKKFEYRKRATKNDVDSIIIYSTSPDMKIVAEVGVEEVLSFSPSKLWEETKSCAGITRSKYREYFKNCKTAYAFKLGGVLIFDPAKSLQDYGISNAPQSFVYIDGTNEEALP